MEKLPISGVVLTQDEAVNISRCLQSLDLCDELLVVDSGSADDTIPIAESLGARVLSHPWEGYGKQRQYSVGQARHDWVLCLDADEWLSDGLVEAIRAEFDAGPAFKAYSFPRQNFFLGKPLRHGGDYPDRKLRLFHRGHARWNAGVVHAVVEADAPARSLHQDLMHYTAENLDAAVAKWARFASMQAQEMRAAGVRPSLRKLLINPLSRFTKLYFIKQGLRDGVAGFSMAVISSFFCFYKYLELWRLTREGAGKS